MEEMPNARFSSIAHCCLSLIRMIHRMAVLRRSVVWVALSRLAAAQQTCRPKSRCPIQLLVTKMQCFWTITRPCLLLRPRRTVLRECTNDLSLAYVVRLRSRHAWPSSSIRAWLASLIILRVAPARKVSTGLAQWAHRYFSWRHMSMISGRL